MVNARKARQLARVRAERDAALRAAQRARRRRLGTIGGAVVAVLAVLGTGLGLAVASAGHSPKASAAASRRACSYTAETAENSERGTRHYGLPPDRKATGNPVATIVTNRGTITAALDAPQAPCTVNSFEFLAAKGYFNDTICQRLTAYPATSATERGLHILQCGDPTGTGGGGPGYTIPDENLTGATYPIGTLAMANTGKKHTGGSQFFFVYGPSTLPPTYTPFGAVTSGLSVLKAIAAKGETKTKREPDGKPKEKVLIKRFTIKG